MTTLVEPEIMWGRRAFPQAQQLLAGAIDHSLPGVVATGWHDTSVQAEMGAFAVVRGGAGLDDLIGEILLVEAQNRGVYVYCLGSADVPTDLSLARRAFFALGLLALESLDATVSVIA